MKLNPVKRNINKLQIAAKRPFLLNPVDFILVCSLALERKGAKFALTKNGTYIHTELVFPNWTKMIDRNVAENGTSFSSSIRGLRRKKSKRGVSFVDIRYRHQKRWHFYNVSNQNTTYIINTLERAQQIVGCKYDSSVVKRYGLDIEADIADAYFCSESNAYALGYSNILLPPHGLVVKNSSFAGRANK